MTSFKEKIMRYEKPIYSIENLEAKDIVTFSFIRDEITVTEVFDDQAEVSVSANDVLG